MNNRDAYHTLYKQVCDFDKHIGMRYGSITGSDYLFVVVGLLRDGLVERRELERFSENAQQGVEFILKI